MGEGANGRNWRRWGINKQDGYRLGLIFLIKAFPSRGSGDLPHSSEMHVRTSARPLAQSSARFHVMLPHPSSPLRLGNKKLRPSPAFCYISFSLNTFSKTGIMTNYRPTPSPNLSLQNFSHKNDLPFETRLLRNSYATLSVLTRNRWV